MADKFKKKYSMEENISEENKSASEAIHNDWKSNDLRKVPKDYQLNIFECWWNGILLKKCLPNKTLTFKDYDDCYGGKNSKNRIILLVGTNTSVKKKLNQKYNWIFRSV